MTILRPIHSLKNRSNKTLNVIMLRISILVLTVYLSGCSQMIASVMPSSLKSGNSALSANRHEVWAYEDTKMSYNKRFEMEASKVCNGGNYSVEEKNLIEDSDPRRVEGIVRCQSTKSKSSRSELVKAAQVQLNERGYNAGVADGILGSGTKNAIEEFQADEGLDVTGKLDAATRSALGL